MGIQGLLQCIKPATSVGHISSFRGKRVAVDTYAWIHKALYGSSIDFLRDGVSNSSWINYCLHILDMLLHFEVRIISRTN